MDNSKFEKILHFLSGKIPLNQLESDREIFNKSDATIALECLCSQIADNDVRLTSEIFEDLKILCEKKGVDSSYLNDLKDCIQKE